MEEDSKPMAAHDSFRMELTKINRLTCAAKSRPGGVVSCTAKYRRSSTGYMGRIFADGVALARAPRGIREVAYRDLTVRDWDVSMAYSTFASQAVDKLAVNQEIPYFRLSAGNPYIQSRETLRKSTRDIREAKAPN